MPQAREYDNRCESLYSQNALPIMKAVNRHHCPDVCSINDKGGVYYDTVKLPWHSFYIAPNMDMQIKAAHSHAKAIGLNLANNFYYPGNTGYDEHDDLDYTDVLTNVWGDDLCMLVDTDDAQQCLKYYNSETGEICAPAADGLYLSGFGPRCSSAARDYGGFDDAISMDDTVWVSHCEDIPTCVSSTNDCTLKTVEDNNCITSFQYDELGLPRRCYKSSTHGMCVDFIDSTQKRVPWCAGVPH